MQSDNVNMHFIDSAFLPVKHYAECWCNPSCELSFGVMEFYFSMPGFQCHLWFQGKKCVFALWIYGTFLSHCKIHWSLIWHVWRRLNKLKSFADSFILRYWVESEHCTNLMLNWFTFTENSFFSAEEIIFKCLVILFILWNYIGN